MQNDQNKPAETASKKTNLFVIAAVLLLAAVLFIVSRVIPKPNEGLSKEDIHSQIAALAIPAPTVQTQETANPAAEPRETGSPAPKDQPTETTVTADADAYLFIILNNRVWGIEPLGEEREITVDQGDGVVNVIHLLPDGFYMASSTCDNQLCVSEGTVTVDNYQRRILGASVLCLPHHLDLELVVPSHTPDPNAPDI